MKNNINYEEIIDTILMRCEEQAEYYKTIAYSSDYKEQTVERIVNLGIAYSDVAQYIKLIISNALEKQSAVAKATRLGFPTAVGQAIADANDYNNKADTKTETQSIVQPTVAQTDSK